MSNPKEKADELIDKMYYIGRYDDKEDYNPAMAWERAIQCALIAVDEMIELCDSYVAPYYYEVKKELEEMR